TALPTPPPFPYTTLFRSPRARLTFAELDRACHRVGHMLAAHGVAPGDRVSVLSDNCAELVVLFLGILRYGAVVNPLNVEVSLKRSEEHTSELQSRFDLVC